MGNDTHADGTTGPMRGYRSILDNHSRPDRISYYYSEAERALTTIADLAELHGANVGLLRQDAKTIRDRAAQVREWWRPR